MASEPSVLVARCNGPTTNSRRLFNPSEVHTTRFRYAFREQRPEDGITTAWVNLTFIDNNGRSAEVDVLLMTRAGMALRPAAGGSDNRSYATGCQRT